MYCTRNEQYMCGLAWPSGVVHHPQALCAVSSRVWVRVPVMLPVPLSKALNQNEQGLLVLSNFYEIGPFSFTLVPFQNIPIVILKLKWKWLLLQKNCQNCILHNVSGRCLTYM